MNKKDMFIKEKLQQDKEISDRANQIFENLKEEFIMDNNKDKKVITISFKRFLALAASFVMVIFLGTNLYAHTLGKPNIFTAIKNLFNVDTEDYNAAEEDINITVESNGVKLTLKTAAMDDNVLIVKYVAEGEKLEDEFYTYQDFEKTQIDVNSIWAKLAGDNIEGYEGYTLKDVTIMQKDIVEKLKKQGLTDEEAKELADLGAEAYKEYIGSQLSETEYSEEKAKEKIEQVVAMFESKVTSKYEIITSEDKLSEFGIDAISETIEKQDGKYIIHAIYNVDTLIDILSEFNLNLNVVAIGTIEGNWNYSVNLNKANLNKRVETIEFYNEYETILERDSEGAEGENELKVTLNQLSISDFSSVLNIKTIRNDYYNKTSDIIPLTFVVLNENDEVIGTSCQTSEDVIKTNPIVDKVILKDVDYNTEKITIKMYSNKDNTLLESLEVNLKEARNLMDTSLENTFYNSAQDWICFNFPKDWKERETADALSILLLTPENLDGDFATLSINICLDEAESVIEFYNDESNIENIKVGKDNISADCKVTSDNDMISKHIVLCDGTIVYNIKFSGEKKIYTKYEPIFEKILETMSFSKPNYWDGPAKQYTVFSNGGYEIIKLYEDNELTISLKDGAIENLKKLGVIDSVSSDFQEEIEYKITGLDEKVVNVYISKAAYQECYGMPLVIIRTENEKIYSVNLMKGIELNTFSIEGPFVSGIAEWNVTLQPMSYISGDNRKFYGAWLSDYYGRKFILRYEDFYKGELFFSEIISQPEISDEKADLSNSNEISDTEVNLKEDFSSREELYQFLYGDMSWTEGRSVGMRFEYPSNFRLSRLKESYDISNSGECATSLWGSVPARNSKTEEIKDIELVINIFEPKFVDEVNWEELEKSVKITTQSGREWFLDYSYSVADYDSIVAYKCYQEISGVTGKQYIEYKIEFTNLQKDFNIEYFESKILDSVKFTSF